MSDSLLSLQLCGIRGEAVGSEVYTGSVGKLSECVSSCVQNFMGHVAQIMSRCSVEKGLCRTMLFKLRVTIHYWLVIDCYLDLAKLSKSISKQVVSGAEVITKYGSWFYFTYE